MEKGVLGGLIVIIVVAAVAGVLVFNSFNPKTSGSSNVINIVNQTTENNTNNTDFLSSTNILLNYVPFLSGSNGQSTYPSAPVPVVDPSDRMISLFDAYVKSIFPQSNVPGAAVVIVKDNKIIYLNTLGYKDLASGAPVTPKTLFEIGSCSKAFTSTNIAQLVSAGLMRWDDPIVKYYNNSSEFQMYDPSVTGNITIRDCLSHRSGQPGYSQDMEWITFNDSYSQMLYNLRLVKNDTPFNTTYNYNNIIYALPGYCAAKVTNKTWSDLIKEDLLNPLGMTTATTTVKDFLNSPDHITPYLLLGNGTFIPFVASIDAVGPAGVLGVSITEMANWLKFQLEDTGMYNGVQIVSKKELDETKTGQINMTADTKYGMGWVVTKNVISHAGDALSSQTTTALFPSRGIGMVVISNVGPIGQDFNNALLYKLFYLLGGDENTDPWPTFKDQHKPVPYPAPAPPVVAPMGLGNYTGVYNNYLYGNINITLENGTLKCYYGNNQKPNDLVHWNDSVFLDKLYQSPLTFSDIHNGSAHGLEVASLKDYSTVPATDKSYFNRTGQ